MGGPWRLFRAARAPEAVPGRIWLHADAGEGAAAGAAAALAGTLAEIADPGQLVITGAGAAVAGARVPVKLSGGRRGLRAFLSEWRPALGLMVAPPLPGAALIAAAGWAGLPLHLVLAGTPARLPARRLRRFALVHVDDTRAAAAVRRAGLPAGRVSSVGPLGIPPQPPAAPAPARAALAQALVHRPVWYAAGLTEAEIAPALAAHRVLMRRVHRLVMVLAPATGADGAALAQRLSAEGWQLARRGAGELPGERCEIVLADAAGEEGLWLRLAPVTLLGGTLAGSGPTLRPDWAAQLGSALLAGPARGTGAGAEALEALAGAGGLRRIETGQALVPALEALLNPAEAAAQASAAWDVVTAPAGATRQVVRRALAAAG